MGGGGRKYSYLIFLLYMYICVYIYIYVCVCMYVYTYDMYIIDIFLISRILNRYISLRREKGKNDGNGQNGRRPMKEKESRKERRVIDSAT